MIYQEMETLKKEIPISNETFLKDIQTRFNTYYPYLKIEFSEPKKSLLKIGSANNHSSKQVKDVSYLSEPVAIDVSDDHTIEQVVKDFKKDSGTNIDVYRKSGNVWNVITLTDSWTLESQNKAGKFISCEMQSTT